MNQGRIACWVLTAVVLSTLLAPVRPSFAAEDVLLPRKPIDRKFPAFEYCQIPDTIRFTPIRSCSVYIDFAVKLTDASGGSFGLVALDSIRILRYSDLVVTPCQGCKRLDYDNTPDHFCYSGNPVFEEDFEGNWPSRGWRLGPGASVGSVSDADPSPALKFGPSPLLPGFPCDTVRARLALTNLSLGVEYVVIGWMWVESPSPGAPPLFVGISQSSDCPGPGEPSSWPFLPSQCPYPTPCSISGDTVGCAPLRLCGPGPADNYSYSWTGPNGFTANSQCIGADTSGTYRLIVTDGTTLEASPPCSVTVTVGGDTCGPPTFNCPRRPGFWSLQCDHKSKSGSRFTHRELAEIARCVFETSDFFEGNPLGGFCAAIDSHPVNLRKQAIRQFAALLANVCVGDLGFATKNGTHVGLDPATVVKCWGRYQTIGDVIKEVDASLIELRGANLGRTAVRRAYTNIVNCLSRINRGDGMKFDCGFKKDELAEGEVEDEPLVEQELVAENDVGAEAEARVELHRPYPNPFTGTTRIAFEVGAGGAPVHIGVYDISGRLVRALVSGFVETGRHETHWNGMDASGVRVRAGAYFVRVVIGGVRFGNRVMLMK